MGATITASSIPVPHAQSSRRSVRDRATESEEGRATGIGQTSGRLRKEVTAVDEEEGSAHRCVPEGEALECDGGALESGGNQAAEAAAEPGQQRQRQRSTYGAVCGQHRQRGAPHHCAARITPLRE
jgi:hypothetical protein